MRLRYAFAVLVPAALFAAPARSADLPADLKAVPGEALGFVHVRVADVWKSDAFKEVRETVMKAGAKALEGFDQRFLPHPSSLERLTLVVLPRDEELKQEPAFVAILATSKAIDKEAFLKSALPGAEEQKRPGGTYYVDRKSQTAVSFVNEQVIAFGPAEGLRTYYGRAWKADGALAEALRAADSKRHITAAVNTSLIPDKALRDAPPAVLTLLKAKTVTVALDVGGEVQIDAGLHYADAKQAGEAERAVKDLAALGREKLKEGRKELLDKVIGDGKVAPLDRLPETALALFALGSIERIDEILADPPVKRDGTTLSASLKLDRGNGVLGLTAVGVGLLLPAVQKVREAAARAQSQNNLKQIGLAIHNYASTYDDELPPAAICDKKGKSLLSWRVAILPYIEQDNLYKQFHLDEPWDSEHNIKLLQHKPRVYFHPQAPPSSLEKGLTHYRIFTGKDAMFDVIKSRKISAIPDGTSNTIMVFEAEEGVPWTKPDEFEYDAKKPLPKFAKFTPNGFNILLGDGSVRFLSSSVSEKTLRALITADGGEVLGPDF